MHVNVDECHYSVWFFYFAGLQRDLGQQLYFPIRKGWNCYLVTTAVQFSGRCYGKSNAVLVMGTAANSRSDQAVKQQTWNRMNLHEKKFCLYGGRKSQNLHTEITGCTTWSVNIRGLTIQTTANVKVPPILNILSIYVSSTSDFHTGSSIIERSKNVDIEFSSGKSLNDPCDCSRLNRWKVSILTHVTTRNNPRRVSILTFIQSRFLSIFPAILDGLKVQNYWGR